MTLFSSIYYACSDFKNVVFKVIKITKYPKPEIKIILLFFSDTSKLICPVVVIFNLSKLFSKFLQETNVLGNWESVCQDPIEGFEVYFTHSHTSQQVKWAEEGMIYIAAHTAGNNDTVSYQVSEILTVHIITTRGNPIEYAVDWVGNGPSASNGPLAENVTIDGKHV